MRHIIYTILLLFIAPFCKGQSTTLEQCQQMAQANYPSIIQYGLIDKLSEYNISNARRNWLPQVSFSATAIYSSEVPSMPAMNTPQSTNLIPNTIYGASIGIEQTIWDGGMIKAQVETSKADAEVSKRQLESEMYALRQRINQLYFGSLLLQENIKTADILIEELNRNYNILSSLALYGAANSNELDKIKVEVLSAEQQRIALKSTYNTYIQMLGFMTNGGIDTSTTLKKPSMTNISTKKEIKRPELAVFDAQNKLLNVQRKAINSSVMPQIGAFVNGLYYNVSPDIFNNMMNDKSSPFLLAGIRLQWKINNFYTRKNKLAQIDINANRLNSQRETLLYNLNLQSIQEQAAIDKMTEIISYDDNIIEIRINIRKRTEVLVANGEAGVNDLLRDIGAEDVARRNKAAHEIEWLKNIYDFKYTINE